MSDCSNCAWADIVRNETVVNTFGNTTVTQNGKENITCQFKGDRTLNIDDNFNMVCSAHKQRE